MYEEILKLKEYCDKHGIEAKVYPLFDGWKIQFANGMDVIQHQFSHGCEDGCVEPAVGSRCDYDGVSLECAKRLVSRRKDQLNGRKELKNATP